MITTKLPFIYLRFVYKKHNVKHTFCNYITFITLFRHPSKLFKISISPLIFIVNISRIKITIKRTYSTFFPPVLIHSIDLKDNFGSDPRDQDSESYDSTKTPKLTV